MRWLQIIILLLIAAFASAASLQWDASAVDEDHAAPTGYRIHRGTATGVYDWQIDVGNVLQWPIPDDLYGEYYWAATAYNDAGQSGYSNEVFWQRTPPEPPQYVGATNLRASKLQQQLEQQMAIVFSDGFESGDFSAWDSENDGAGMLSVSSSDPIDGSYSALLNLTSNEPAYLTAGFDTITQQTTVVVKLNINDVSGVSTAQNHLYILRLQGDDPLTDIFWFSLYPDASNNVTGGYVKFYYNTSNSITAVNFGGYLTAGEHIIKILWTPSGSTAGIKIKIDTNQVFNESNSAYEATNYDLRSINLGPIAYTTGWSTSNGTQIKLDYVYVVDNADAYADDWSPGGGASAVPAVMRSYRARRN